MHSTTSSPKTMSETSAPTRPRRPVDVAAKLIEVAFRTLFKCIMAGTKSKVYNMGTHPGSGSPTQPPGGLLHPRLGHWQTRRRSPGCARGHRFGGFGGCPGSRSGLWGVPRQSEVGCGSFTSTGCKVHAPGHAAPPRLPASGGCPLQQGQLCPPVLAGAGDCPGCHVSMWGVLVGSEAGCGSHLPTGWAVHAPG